MDWVYVAKFRDKWRAFMYTVMNFRVHKIRVLPWLAEELLAFFEGLHRGLS